MQVIFSHKVAEADNIYTFFFKTESPMHYTAGQFTELTLKHEHPDDRGVRRWFTLSSSPTDALVSITTKIEKDHLSSFKAALLELESGVELHMAEAMGDFVLPKLIQTPLIFVAGGIGITPFHSMLGWLQATKESRPIKLIYAVRNEDELIFQETLKKSGIHTTTIVSYPSAAWGGERGRLTADFILALDRPTDDTLVYVSGPEPMVESLEAGLRKAGLRKDQFVGDFFPNYEVI